jgi:hypothetical protein
MFHVRISYIEVQLPLTQRKNLLKLNFFTPLLWSNLLGSHKNTMGRQFFWILLKWFKLVSVWLEHTSLVLVLAPRLIFVLSRQVYTWYWNWEEVGNALGHTSQVGSLLPVSIQVLTLSVDLNVKACTQCLPVCTKPTLDVNAGINVGLNF